nr:hypothetical protein [Nanchangia anserum]
MRENPEGPVATVVDKVTGHPSVVKAKEQTKAKASHTIRKQGEAVTDKVADMVKDRLFGATTKTEPDYVDVHVEEVTPPQNPPAC